MTTAWEMHDDPEVTLNPRPAGALTVKGWRLMNCAIGCSNAASGARNLTGHQAALGSVYWACVHCGTVREASACTPEDFPSEAAPAQLKTANLAVPGAEDSSAPDVRPGALCIECGKDEAVLTAYFDDLGRTANLLPWCGSILAPLTVAIGLPVTLLPLEPIPGLAELRAQLDRAQLGDRPAVDHHQEAAELVRRTGPAAPQGRKPGEWR